MRRSIVQLAENIAASGRQGASRMLYPASPNDDDDDDDEDEEDEKDKDRHDEPAVIREPDEDD